MLDSYLHSWKDFFKYLAHPSWNHYVYLLLIISLFCLIWEWVFPWRKNQARIRKDFWLDGFYMFFNMFFFPLLIFNLLSSVAHDGWLDALSIFGLESTQAFSLVGVPFWIQFWGYFVLRDFVHWNAHRLLHRVPLLWEFHKVHHSVEQMGFAAHLRYHWFENIFYRVLEFLPLSLLGWTLNDFILMYILTILIGHLNHSNIVLPLGPLKYILNNPQMHIWHHSKSLPQKYGVNFGLSLSLWDYLFKTAYIPKNGRDIPLGFPDLEKFPRSFLGQAAYPWIKSK